MALSKIVGIEIDDHAIKVIQAENEGSGFSITKFMSSRFSSLSEELPRLATTLKGLGLDTKRVILFIPRSKFSVHYVSFPTKDPLELNEMAKFRAKRQLLYSKEEIMHGFRIIGSDPKGDSKIMLVVVREDVVNNYLKTLTASRINPFVITMNALGLANWYHHRFPQQNKDLCVVDIDFKTTVISVLNRGKLVFSREVNKGMEVLETSEAGASEIVMEIQHSLSAYDKEEIGPAMKEILVTGAVKGIEKLAMVLREALGMEVNFLSPLDGLILDEAVKEGVLGQAQDFSFSKVLGSLAAAENFDINIISRGAEKKKSALSLYQTRILQILLYVWFFASIGAILGWEVYRQNSYASKLKKQLWAINKRIEALENKQKAINLTLAHLNRPASFLHVFKEIAEGLPPGIYLRRFEYRNQKKEVVIDGSATSSEEITKLMDNLQSSNLFKQVNQKYVRASGTKEGNTFQVEIQFK